jgi:hypothetical protein
MDGEIQMARRAWIALLGFGLFLFVSIDLCVLACVLTGYWKPDKLGGLLIFGIATWQVYVALKKRMDSTPELARKSTRRAPKHEPKGLAPPLGK